MSRFAFTYEDPEYVRDEDLVPETEEQDEQVEPDEVYSPYHGA